MRIDIVRLATVVALLGAPASTMAEDPKFVYAKQEDVAGVEWKASAQAGLIHTTGNSRVTTMAGGAKVSRKSGANKLEIETGAAYARSSVLLATDFDGDGFISSDELDRNTATTTKAWQIKTRYDRFLTANNSVYASASAAADEPAGKEFVGGGQVGYSRQLVKRVAHALVGEGGYDLSYEDLAVGDPLTIHSLRAFVGYEGAVRADTGVAASIEMLANLNSLDSATGPVGSFEDRRTTFKASVTTKVFDDVSFRFSFEAKHDNAPAPLKPPSLSFEPGFIPLADALDTKTEAALIVSFL
jgi:hypothetical protein